MVKKIGMIVAGAALVAAHCLIGGLVFAGSYTQDGKPCPPECVSDSMEIVTWYPSPYNEYEELRLYPTQRDDNYCDNDKIGLMYYDDGGTPSFGDDDKMRVCKGTLLGWQEVGLAYWGASGNNIYNTNSGNVGIGTKDPLGALHVKGNGSQTHAQVYIESLFGGLPYLFLKDGNSGTSQVIYNNLGDLHFRRCTSAGCTGVAGQDDTFMVIKSSGNVGIGTTTPNALLHVAGNIGIPTSPEPTILGGMIRGVSYYGDKNKIPAAIEFVRDNNHSTGEEGRIIFRATDSPTALAPERMVIQGNGNVGIGTTNPQGKLDIHTADYLQNFRWIVDSGSGSESGAYVRLRSNDAYGVLELGSSSDAGALIHTTGLWRWTSQLNIMGDIGIGGVNAGPYKCYINGTGYLNAAAWAYGSDLRLKENISYIQSGLNVVEHLKPVKFDYIKGDKRQAGFIAQEVREVLPDIVTEGADGMLGVKTDSIIPYLVKAIQEQQKEIEALKEKLNAGKKVDKK